MTNGAREITEDECDTLGAWRLGPIISAYVPATGTVNRTIIVHTSNGPFVLRISSRERLRVEWEHACIFHAADQGLPVCHPVSLPDGHTILERGGKFFTLFPMALGQQLARGELNAQHAQAAGECLARIHVCFQSLPPDRYRIKNLNGDYRIHPDTIGRIESAILALPMQTNVDRNALSHLQARRTWLEKSGNEMEGVQKRLETLPQFVLHGDYQETNLFFKDSSVSAVIDWDQSGLAARGWEVVRALHLMVGLSVEMCSKFLLGYRSVLSFSNDELEESAACYGVLADNNLWVYMAAYLEGNERAKQFIGPDPFIPFQVEWKAANLAEVFVL